MTRLEKLIDELTHEAETARRHLERLPDAHFDWRPHPKSFTAGSLGGHLVECIRWAEWVFAGDGIDLDPANYQPVRAMSVAELLRLFDATLERALAAMAKSPDHDATGEWTMRVGGRVQFVKAREDALRDLSLSHLVHHRGQLTVYLRLLDVPVAWTYGPTADERS